MMDFLDYLDENTKEWNQVPGFDPALDDPFVSFRFHSTDSYDLGCEAQQAKSDDFKGSDRTEPCSLLGPSSSSSSEKLNALHLFAQILDTTPAAEHAFTNETDFRL